MTNKLAIAMIWKGTRSLTSNFFHFVDYCVYHFPYAFIILSVLLSVLIGVWSVGNARMERDKLAYENYLLEMKIDSLNSLK